MHFYQANPRVTTSATNSHNFFFPSCIQWCSGGSVLTWWLCLNLILGFVVFGGGVW